MLLHVGEIGDTGLVLLVIPTRILVVYASDDQLPLYPLCRLQVRPRRIDRYSISPGWVGDFGGKHCVSLFELGPGCNPWNPRRKVYRHRDMHTIFRGDHYHRNQYSILGMINHCSVLPPLLIVW